MNRFVKLTLAATLMLGAAFTVAQAQQAAAPQPPAPCQNMDDPACGPQSQDDGWGQMAEGGGRHHGHHGEKGRGDDEGGRGPHMRLIDANNDGIIGADEAASLADHAFMRMDQDRDGKLTEAEFSTGPHGKRGWFSFSQAESDAVLKLRKENFAKLDANKDAGLSKVEFFEDAKAKLAAADADKDGKVTPWEFRAAN